MFFLCYAVLTVYVVCAWGQNKPTSECESNPDVHQAKVSGAMHELEKKLL